MADSFNPGDLHRLGDLGDLEVAEGEPDPRGWNVLASDGRRIGDVEDLLVDEGAMKVRYLEVDVAEKDLGLSQGDRQILVPIGYASLDRGEHTVRVDRLASNQIAGIQGRVDLATMGTVAAVSRATPRRDTARRAESPRRDEGERHITRAEEELEIGKRSVQAGEVDVEKHVETEHIRKPVSLSHEEVDIDRHPVTGQRAAGRGDFRDEEVRIPLTEEEAVVSKKPVVREEIVVRKKQVTGQKDVEADVRKERVDIHKRDTHGGDIGTGRDTSRDTRDIGRGDTGYKGSGTERR